MTAATAILRIALPVPLRRLFDYLPPAGIDVSSLQPGLRLRVPFGNQLLVGTLIAVHSHSEVPVERLRCAQRLLDDEPLLPPVLFELAQWAAQYYQHPLGEVLAAVLPQPLREGAARVPERERHWRCVADATPDLRAGSKARQLFEWLHATQSADRATIYANGFTAAQLKTLVDKQLVETFVADNTIINAQAVLAEKPLPLNEEQAVAVASIAHNRFQVTLLEGVTGSGKTEVYLQLIAHTLQQGRQAMVLVPEIGLTPQTVARFQRRFRCEIAVMHSGLAQGQRFAAWRSMASGAARILIGTRSAIFTPMAQPGIIIIDEEHDSSFKQQDGFRYSARDLAVLRAQRENIPILLGSATPSLETLHNATHERYQHLRLTRRAGKASSPAISVIDTGKTALTEGMSRELLDEMRNELARGNQVLVFLNRRGYAPAMSCDDCRWFGQCPHCAVRMTVHRKAGLLRCHHCDHREVLPQRCPQCDSTRLSFVGIGTQRSEQFLLEQFAEYPVWRIDRDSMSHRSALDEQLQAVHSGRPGLLVGTQMLAKGHHFPHVTLVAILDIDSGLFSADFRAAEKMGQLLEQVAGRAGRAEKPGRVLIQSRFAEHPLLQTLLHDGYQRLARLLLAERQAAGLPPYAHLALLRAEHSDPHRAQLQLRQWCKYLREVAVTGVQISGPLPALMEKRAGLYRFDVHIKSLQRSTLQQTLATFCAGVDQQGLPSGLRWSLDVDPVG